jgi:hypothetical protein
VLVGGRDGKEGIKRYGVDGYMDHGCGISRENTSDTSLFMHATTFEV